MAMLDLFVLISLIAASRSALATQSLQWPLPLGFADVCPSTPLISTLACKNLDAGIDGPDLFDGNDTRVSAGESEPEQDPEAGPELEQGWIGGKRCAGEFCLYANKGFAGGRGIVLITDAAGFENVKLRDEKLSPWPPSASGDSSSPSPPAWPPYEVAEMDGKGLGLLANKTLSRGDTVMVHPPVLLAHRFFVERTPPEKKLPLLDLVPPLFPPATRDAFLAQMGHFGGHKVSDIMTTNSFQMVLSPGQAGPGAADSHHYGNFPEVSRFNHDCRPNVVFHVGGDLVHRTTVVRDVRAGEELSISYLDQTGPRSVRQHRAKRAWGFECGCSQCRLGGADAAKSDARLMEIEELERLLSDVKTKTEVSLATVERYIKLFKDERLESKMAGAYTTAALNCNLLGKGKMAVKYAEMAVEAGIIEGGPGIPDVEAMKGLAADPKGHFTWRRRLK